MKKAMTALTIGLILTASIVIAQEEELPSPGLLPDNPFYPVKTLFERVRLWITFNNEARARLRLHFARLRLAEMREMIKRQKLQYVERLRVRYENELNETENELKRAEALGRNVTALAEHVSNMTYKHIVVLEKVLERVPEQAKPAIERAINISIRRHEALSERLKEKIKARNRMARRLNCTTDADCRHLPCVMVVGNDTPICKEGKCICGAKWEIVNKTEWKERFGENLTAERQEIIQRIRERMLSERQRIARIITRKV